MSCFFQLSECINSLREDIKEAKTMYDEMRALNPSFEQVSEDHWNQAEARFWVHGTTKPSEIAELQKWLYASTPVTTTEKNRAECYYSEWNAYIQDRGVYADFDKKHLLPPLKNETLKEYIQRLADQVETHGWGTKSNRLALKCFLTFLREEYKDEKEEIAFIDHVFPLQMDLKHNRIIRKIRPQVYPVSQEVVAMIIQELAYQCAYGRANAQHHAGEALALVWLCLAASRIRLPRSLESIHEIKHTSLEFKDHHPILKIPSTFGLYEVQISHRITKFLQAIAKIPSPLPRNTIIQTPIEDLRKTLRTAIEKADIPKELNAAAITFLTFLSPPHHFGKTIR